MKNRLFRDRLLTSTIIVGAAMLAATGAAAQNDPQSGANPAAPAIGGSSSAGVPTTAATGTDATGNAQAAEQGTIVVTGSRIASANLTSISPLTVVSNQELKMQGTTRVEDLINSLPQAFASQGGGISNGSTGTATVNLRNLGDNRTLVLINGKRLLPGDPTSSAADLNNIPAALVERVDVITGGASAVYGSDAVAGVVNFVMNKSFEGFRVDAQYSLYQHNNNDTNVQGILGQRGFPAPDGNVVDGATKDITAVMGVNSADGKGNITAYAGYRKINAVLQRDRDYSACSLAETGSTFACSGSGTTSPARFITNGGAGSQLTLDPAAPNSNGFRPYVGSRDAFNFAPYNYYQRPDERYTLGAFAHYEVSEAFDPYMELMFMDDHTKAQIAPSGIFGQVLDINCDNPLLSAGQRTAICGATNGAGAGVAGTTGSVSISKRNVEGGGRIDDIRHTSYRIVVGGRGKINDAFSYDVYGQFGRTIYAENYQNDFSVARTQEALNVVTGANGTAECANAAARAAGCVPYNIFSANGVTPGALAYLQTPGFKEGSTTEYVADASITGQLGEYGIKSPFADEGLGIAIGAEYRKESLDLKTDSEFTTGDLAGQGGPTIGINGSFDVKELFGEARLPLVEDKPFIHSLSVEAGYRYSDYNTAAGTTNTYKFGGEYSPVDGLRFRGGYNRAVRAPNIQELYSAQSIGLFAGSDPCAGAAVNGLVNGNTAAQCANSGVTAAQFGNIASNSANQYSALFGGNTDLKPEKSDTYTAGILIAPVSFARGLVLSADYFVIKVDNQISTVGANLTLAQCVASGNPTFCNLVQRDPSNGSLFLGTVGKVIDTNVNVGGVKTSGVDVGASYRFELDQVGLANLGSLGFDFAGTYTDKYKVTPGVTASDGTTSYDCAGYYGITCQTGGNSAPIPKWRNKLRVTLNTPGNFQLSGNWRHVGSVKSDQTQTNSFTAGTTFPVDAKIKSYDYFDVSASVRIAEKYSFRVGVNNLTDKDPPLIGSSSLAGVYGNGNTYPQVYDALGRYLYAGFTFDF